MLTYRITYAHENANETDEKKRHGYAMQEVLVDHEITETEDLVEIARSIGKEQGYTSVGIVKVEQKIEDDAE